MIKKIIDKNESDLIKRKSEKSVESLEKEIENLPQVLDFYGTFSDFGIIAEIKLASPSAGVLADKSRVLDFASDYKDGGAHAISVISEKYFFNGGISFIKDVKEKTGLPVLQKDFVVDAYQIYEARAYGADALLLIAKIISSEHLKQFVDICLEVGMEPVVEINDELDLENTLQTKTRVIAVNARDLDNFKVDVEKACELLKKIPKHFLKLGFSGVNSKEEVSRYRQAGVSGVLVGTNLIKAEDKVRFIKDLKL